MKNQYKDLKIKQLQFERVQHAYAKVWPNLKTALNRIEISEPYTLLFNVYKTEQILEVWIKNKLDKSYKLFKSYPFTAISGKLGPKNKEGDLQIPEGNYQLTVFNAKSKFHLSIGLNYPNAIDLLRIKATDNPGGDIYIHGGAKSTGCIAIGDEYMEEVYLLALESLNESNQSLPVFIYPFKMEESSLLPQKEEYSEHYDFWLKIQEDYLHFKKHNFPRERTL